MSPGHGKMSVRDKALFRSSAVHAGVNAQSHAHDAEHIKALKAARAAHSASAGSTSIPNSSPAIRKPALSMSTGARPPRTPATSRVQKRTTPSPPENQDAGNGKLRRSSLNLSHHREKKSNTSAVEAELQHYSGSRTIDRENRELLLLGENTRLKHKINSVLDEAEQTISALMHEEIGGIKGVRKHYREMLKQQRLIATDYAAEAAYFESQCEGLEDDLAAQQNVIRSLLFDDKQLHTIEEMWVKSRASRTAESRQAKQAIYDAAEIEEAQISRKEKDHDAKMAVDGLDVDMDGCEDTLYAQLEEMEELHGQDHHEHKRLLSSNSGSKGEKEYIGNGAEESKCTVGNDSGSAAATADNAASELDSAEAELNKSDSHLHADKVLVEIHRLNAKNVSLRDALHAAELEAEEKGNETAAALLLLQTLTNSNTWTKDRNMKDFSNAEVQNKQREKDLLRSIKASNPVRSFGGSSRLGMHPAYHAVPYQQRLAQIRHDKSTMHALEAEQAQAEERLHNIQDKDARAAKQAAEAALEATKKGGRSTKSGSVGLVPKNFNLMQTPAKKNEWSKDVHGKWSPKLEELNEGEGGDEGPRSPSKVPHPHHQSLYSSVQQQYDDEDDEDVKEQRRAARHEIHRQLDTLWHSSTTAHALPDLEDSDVDEEVLVRVPESKTQTDQQQGGGHAPICLASLLLQLTHLVATDLCVLREMSAEAEQTRKELEAEAAPIKTQLDLQHAEAARLKSQLQEANFATQTALSEQHTLENLIRNVQAEQVRVENEANIHLREHGKEISHLKAQLEQAKTFNQSAHDQIAAAQESDTAAKMQVKKLENQLTEYEELKETEEGHKKLVEKLKKAIAAAEQEHMEIQETLSQELDSKKQEHEQISAALKQAKVQLSAKVQEHDELALRFSQYDERRKQEALAKAGQYEHDVGLLHDEVTSLQSKIESMRATHKREKHQLEEEAAESKAQALAELKHEAAGNAKNLARNTAAAAEALAEENNKALERMTIKCKEWNRRFVEADEQYKEMQQLAQEVQERAEQAEESIYTLKDDLADRTKSLDHAQASLDHALSETSKVEFKQKNILKQLEDVQANYRRSLEQLEKSNMLLAQAQEEAKRNETGIQVASLEAQLEKVREKAKISAELSESNQLAAAASKKMELSLQHQLAHAAAQLETQKTRVSTLEVELRDLKTKLDRDNFEHQIANAQVLADKAQAESQRSADECKRLTVALHSAQKDAKNSERARQLAIREAGTGQDFQQAAIEALQTKHALAATKAQLESTKHELVTLEAQVDQQFITSEADRKLLGEVQNQLAAVKATHPVEIAAVRQECATACEQVLADQQIREAELLQSRQERDSAWEQERDEREKEHQAEIDQLNMSHEVALLEVQQQHNALQKKIEATNVEKQRELKEQQQQHEQNILDLQQLCHSRERELMETQQEQQLQQYNQHQQVQSELQVDASAAVAALREQLEQERQARTSDAEQASIAARDAYLQKEEELNALEKEHDYALSKVMAQCVEERAAAEKELINQHQKKLTEVEEKYMHTLQEAAEAQHAAIAALGASHAKLQADLAYTHAEESQAQARALEHTHIRLRELTLAMQQEVAQKDLLQRAQIEANKRFDYAKVEAQKQLDTQMQHATTHLAQEIDRITSKLEVAAQKRVEALQHENLRLQMSTAEKTKEQLSAAELAAEMAAQTAAEKEKALHNELSVLRASLTEEESLHKSSLETHSLEVQHMQRIHAEAITTLSAQAAQAQTEIEAAHAHTLTRIHADARAEAKQQEQAHLRELTAAKERFSISEQATAEEVEKTRARADEAAVQLNETNQNAHRARLQAELREAQLDRELKGERKKSQIQEQEYEQRLKDCAQREKSLRTQVDDGHKQLLVETQQLAMARASLSSTKARLTATVASLQETQKSLATAESEKSKAISHVSNLQSLLSTHLSQEQAEKLVKSRLQGRVIALQGDVVRLAEVHDKVYPGSPVAKHVRASASSSHSNTLASTSPSKTRSTSPKSSPKLGTVGAMSAQPSPKQSRSPKALQSPKRTASPAPLSLDIGSPSRQQQLRAESEEKTLLKRRLQQQKAAEAAHMEESQVFAQAQEEALENAFAEITQLHEQMSALRTELTAAREHALAKAETEHKAVLQAQSQVQAHALSDAREEIATLQAELKQLYTECSELNDLLSNKQTEESQRKKTLDTATKKISVLTDLVDTLKSKLGSTETQLREASLEKREAELQAETLKRAKVEAAHAAQELNDSRALATSLAETEAQVLAKRLAQADEEILSLTSFLSSAQAEAEVAKTQIKQLNDLVAQMQKQLHEHFIHQREIKLHATAYEHVHEDQSMAQAQALADARSQLSALSLALANVSSNSSTSELTATEIERIEKSQQQLAQVEDTYARALKEAAERATALSAKHAQLQAAAAEAHATELHAQTRKISMANARELELTFAVQNEHAQVEALEQSLQEAQKMAETRAQEHDANIAQEIHRARSEMEAASQKALQASTRREEALQQEVVALRSQLQEMQDHALVGSAEEVEQMLLLRAAEEKCEVLLASVKDWGQKHSLLSSDHKNMRERHMAEVARLKRESEEREQEWEDKHGSLFNIHKSVRLEHAAEISRLKKEAEENVHTVENKHRASGAKLQETIQDQEVTIELLRQEAGEKQHELDELSRQMYAKHKAASDEHNAEMLSFKHEQNKRLVDMQLNGKKAEEVLRVQLAALEYKLMDTQAKLEESQAMYSAVVESSNAALQSLQQTSALVEESLRLQLASSQNRDTSHKNDKTSTSADSIVSALNTSLLAEMSAIEAQFADGAATEDLLKRIFDDAKSPPSKRSASSHHRHHRNRKTAAKAVAFVGSPDGPKLFSQPPQQEQVQNLVQLNESNDPDTATNSNNVSMMTTDNDENASNAGCESDSDTEVHDDDISRRNSADSDISFESVDSRGRHRLAHAAAELSDLSDDEAKGSPSPSPHRVTFLVRRTKAQEANLESAFFKITLLTQRLRAMMQSRDVLISAQSTIRKLLLGIAFTPIEKGRYKQESEVKVLFNQIQGIVASFESMQESMMLRDSRRNVQAIEQFNRTTMSTIGD